MRAGGAVRRRPLGLFLLARERKRRARRPFRVERERFVRPLAAAADAGDHAPPAGDDLGSARHWSPVRRSARRASRMKSCPADRSKLSGFYIDEFFTPMAGGIQDRHDA
jgi:hypothetical protein